MADKMIPYDTALGTARRIAITTLLRYAAQRRDLLDPDHTFQILVKRDYPGVVLPKHLTQPEVMLVLQHQYQNLTMEPSGFGVDLWFNRAPYRCFVPFAAIITFIDKTKGFAVHQEVRMPDAVAPPPHDPPPAPPEGDGVVVSLDAFRKK